MSKYISRTKSKLKFRRIAESEIEQLQGDPMSNKVLADIMKRREEFRARQAARNAQHASHVAPQPKLGLKNVCRGIGKNSNSINICVFQVHLSTRHRRKNVHVGHT